MFQWLKKLLYFPIARYFRFFAQIYLRRWNPRIIVVTGSTGKTTLLHLIQSQLGDKARYSHHANSAYGLPFNILGLKRKNLIVTEWLFLFLAAPFKAFQKPFKEHIYVVEADCDRPGEGKFLSSLLMPSITLWLNSGRTHSQNFDNLVKQKKFLSIESAIAYEFSYFLEYTQDTVIVNGDSSFIENELERTKAAVLFVQKSQLTDYVLIEQGSRFTIQKHEYQLPFILPKQTFYAIAMTITLMNLLKEKLDPTFSAFSSPPGRSTLFKGIKNTFIIDSSYNATPDSMKTILEMFQLYPSQNKWLIIGDMLEQGQQEKEEHEKLADMLKDISMSRLILIGPRVLQYTYPKIKELLNDTVIETFEMPKDVLTYLEQNLKGKETLLFKGARFLEGIIEHLLIDKKDTEKLCRREFIWIKRRKQWGL